MWENLQIYLPVINVKRLKKFNKIFIRSAYKSKIQKIFKSLSKNIYLGKPLVTFPVIFVKRKQM